MKVSQSGRAYSLNQLGSDNKQTFEFVTTPCSIRRQWFGKDELGLLHALILRSTYLNGVLPCAETEDAIALLKEAHKELSHKFAGHTIASPIVIEKVKGHVFVITGTKTVDTRTLTFIRRSGGAVRYEREWPGLQSQEVMRMLIHRLMSINKAQGRQLFNLELYFIRTALFMYEVRAQRRKVERVNRERPSHDDQTRLRPWRAEAQAVQTIERLKTGLDGHIIANLL